MLDIQSDFLQEIYPRIAEFANTAQNFEKLNGDLDTKKEDIDETVYVDILEELSLNVKQKLKKLRAIARACIRDLSKCTEETMVSYSVGNLPSTKLEDENCFLIKNHPLCGVKSYNLKASSNCGVKEYNSGTEGHACGFYKRNCNVLGRNCDDGPNTCRHPNFGVESYHSCRHESHGVELYNDCKVTISKHGTLGICNR